MSKGPWGVSYGKMNEKAVKMIDWLIDWLTGWMKEGTNELVSIVSTYNRWRENIVSTKMS